MKTLSTIKVLTVALLVLVTASCKKDSVKMGLAKPNAANFQSLRNKALADLVQSKTFKAEDGLVFTSTKGAKLKIQSSCLTDLNGNAITGDVTLSFVEIYDRGNMVTTNKPVMGKDNMGNMLPLVTGGEFNLEIKQGNKLLKSGCTFTLEVPSTNTGNFDPNMILWQGNINEDGNLEWNDAKGAQGGDGNILRGDEKGGSYNIWANQFGWTNVDRFYSFSGPKTQIKVTVPEGYNNENAGVYLAYEDQPGLLAQLDTYSASGSYFSEHYGFVPVGMQLHVIFVSESNGSVVYAIKQATIAADAIIHIDEDELNSSTMTNLVTLINNLN